MRTDPELDAVVTRYRRTGRVGRLALFLTLATAVLVAAVELSLLGLLLVGALLLVAVRLPVFRVGGTLTLATDAAPGTVREAFAGERPPPLVFQWGVAETVTPTDDGVAYELPYLFGLRSVTMTVETRETDAGVELDVAVGGSQWARYDAVIEPTEDGTRVEVTVDTDGRFALRQLPAWVAVRRSRTAAFEAQGYTLREHSRSLSV